MKRRSRHQIRAMLLAPVVGALLSACVIQLPAAPIADRTSTPESTPPVSATPETPTMDALARSVVQVLQLDARGERVCSYGSGTIIDSDGTIVTNFHVVRVDDCDEYAAIGIALTDSPDEAPTLTYLAEAYAVDPVADLAVLRITSTLGGGRVSRPFTPVALGDSDAVRLGDEIDILGYPGIGGQTITYTEGKVSGFISAPNIDGRAWLKTDATIAGGNSGGLAADTAGRIVGIPTQASGNPDSGRVTDCRRVQDTNGDGTLDKLDTCIPIGGFLNSLRPINLAKPLIERAATASPIPVAELVPPNATRPSSISPDIGAISFASDVTESDQPVDVVDMLPTGSAKVCAFFDYSGLSDGIPFDVVWKLDGEPDKNLSLYDQSWSLGESGNSWACASSAAGDALGDGLWEVALFFNGSSEATRSASIYIGDEHAPVDFSVVNSTGYPVCWLYLSPDEATTWAANRLAAGTRLGAGQLVSLRLPAGRYDVLARGCDDDRTKVGELDAVSVASGATIEVRR